MSVVARLPLRYRIAHCLARRRLQPLWMQLNKLSYWGLGYNNWISALNGEDRFARRWAARHVNKGAVVFDVGANEGDFTGYLLPLVPDGQFHLFEPNPPTFARLNRRYGGRPNIHLNPCGAGDRPAAIKLHDFSDGTGTERASFLPETFSVILRRPQGDVAEIEVPIVTLDGYCSEHGIDAIDLLKIDTEGFERSVLEGARGCIEKGMIATIQLEFNEQNAISGLNLYRLHEMLPDYDMFRMLADGLAPVLRPDGRYDGHLDVPKYCNLVLLRRGTAGD